MLPILDIFYLIPQPPQKKVGRVSLNKWPIIAQKNIYKNAFFYPEGKQSLCGRSPKELEEDLRSGLYLLTN